jgi:hypothetical protein
MSQIKIITKPHSFTTIRALAFFEAKNTANSTKKRQIVFEDEYGFGFVSLDFWRFPGEGMDRIFEDCFKVGEVCPE